MKGGKLPQGYTIIEVMIVLAISGVMFAIASNFISGKQERTSFQQGSNEFAARIQNLIEQVTDGQYTDVPYYCDASGATLSFPSAPQPTSTCVLLGKLMHFSVAPAIPIGAPGDPKQYEVFTLAGARLNGAAPVTLPSPLTATPFLSTKLAPVVPLGPPPIPITKHLTIPQDLDVKTMHVIPDPSSLIPPPRDHVYNIGFVEGLGNAGDPLNGGYQSGAQTILMVFETADLQGQTETYANSHITPITVALASSAIICVSDDKRSANIMIGSSNNSKLHVEINQLGFKVCS